MTPMSQESDFKVIGEIWAEIARRLVEERGVTINDLGQDEMDQHIKATLLRRFGSGEGLALWDRWCNARDRFLRRKPTSRRRIWRHAELLGVAVELRRDSTSAVEVHPLRITDPVRQDA